jgi:S-adenosylmethionine:tRNA ribosyltransferase-isomerase
MLTQEPNIQWLQPTQAVPTLLDFELPPELEASAPPEARGLQRDGVRLLVSYRATNCIVHTHFRELPSLLHEGDVVVINTSGTINAALPATRADGTGLELHLSTHLPADLWIVELRRPSAKGMEPFGAAYAGEMLQLPGEGSVTLHMPYDRSGTAHHPARLWIATLSLPGALHDYLNAYGFPIRYSYVKEAWPLSAYQTVYATEPGSAEMPSAGRAFTAELLTRLIAKGVQVVPLVLHTGVASLEQHEPPYEEWYRVPETTARIINNAHAARKRVIAVGTTVVRALETVTDANGTIHPGEGWTRMVVTPEHGIHSIDALLTGLHEPRASHLQMLAALADRAHLAHAYAEALRERYLWHEFGDVHLML